MAGDSSCEREVPEIAVWRNWCTFFPYRFRVDLNMCIYLQHIHITSRACIACLYLLLYLRVYIRSLYSVFTDFIACSIGKYIPYTRIGINSIYTYYIILRWCVFTFGFHWLEKVFCFFISGETGTFFYFVIITTFFPLDPDTTQRLSTTAPRNIQTPSCTVSESTYL